ncbi:hypothetical protein GCM10010331_64600 [Streptomyces xanthochromogenes]|nr:hypothetical protein GCM10010331_64600 [Streptomyces xanthochromogenes]
MRHEGCGTFNVVVIRVRKNEMVDGARAYAIHCFQKWHNSRHIHNDSAWPVIDKRTVAMPDV